MLSAQFEPLWIGIWTTGLVHHVQCLAAGKTNKGGGKHGLPVLYWLVVEVWAPGLVLAMSKRVLKRVPAAIAGEIFKQKGRNFWWYSIAVFFFIKKKNASTWRVELCPELLG